MQGAAGGGRRVLRVAYRLLVYGGRMAGMWRVLIYGLTLVSGVLAVGTMALWGASYYYHLAALRSDYHVIGGIEKLRSWEIGWDGGGVGVSSTDLQCVTGKPSGVISQLRKEYSGWEGKREPRRHYPQLDQFSQFNRQWHGFGYGWNDQTALVQQLGLQWHTSKWIAPAWCVQVPFCLLPLYRLWRWRKGAVPAGHCRKCGYDLRASPNQCPECGTVVGAAAQ